MKKYLIAALIALLALTLCSCLEKVEPESVSEPMEPQSVPELESIVEPVEDEASALEAEQEPELELETEPEPELELEPELEPEPEAAGSDDPAVSGDTATSVLAAEPVADAVPLPALAETEAIAATEGPEPESPEAPDSDVRLDSGAIEKELLRLINALREEAGVDALGIDDSMLLAARIRAAEAFESFSHTRPNETPYNTAFDEAGFSYTGKWHGENLSSLSGPSGSLEEAEIALRMFDGLKSSPGHYRNMTEKNFAKAGIGVAVTYTDGNVDVTSAQMFSSR